MRVVFVGQDRLVWKRILWSVLTLSVTRRVWLHRINKEIDGHEALGLNHRRNAIALWAALGAPLVLFAGSAFGLGGGLRWLAILFLVPTGILTFLTARRTARMLVGSGIPYGRPALVWLPTVIPIVGSLWFLAWQQSRLNRFWRHEREHPEHGIEVDLALEDDPAFIIEMREAQKVSHEPASRFEQSRKLRPALEKLGRRMDEVHRERRRVRDLGGSTPVLPWRRPGRVPHRILAVTCTRCNHAFEVRQDPLQETAILCPSCGLLEFIPSLGQDALAPRERRPVRHVKATCPRCERVFHALRPPGGPAGLHCPHCGHAETPAPPAPAQATADVAVPPRRKPAKVSRSRAARRG